MRSIAAECDRAYNGGPPEGYFYQQSSFTPLEAGPEGLDIADLLAGAKVDGQYPNHLDWFAVDLEGEHSAMDGWILEQHAEYVVQAVHRVWLFLISKMESAHSCGTCYYPLVGGYFNVSDWNFHNEDERLMTVHHMGCRF